MKRWLFFLAVPYVVIHTPVKDYKGNEKEDYSYTVINSSTGLRAVWDCFGKEACEDTAEALNQAHERRTETQCCDGFMCGECMKK